MDALRDLPAGGKVSVVTADRTARIVVNETTDMGRVRQALDGIEPTSTSGDLGDALELAGKLAARSGDAQILVATDGALATVPRSPVDARIKVLAVGRAQEPGHRRPCVSDLALGGHPFGVRQRGDFDLEMSPAADRGLGRRRLLEARDLRWTPRHDRTWSSRRSARDRVRSSAWSDADPAVLAGPDDLAIDDRAWAVVPTARTPGDPPRRRGRPYLETALSYLPNVSCLRGARAIRRTRSGRTAATGT